MLDTPERGLKSSTVRLNCHGPLNSDLQGKTFMADVTAPSHLERGWNEASLRECEQAKCDACVVSWFDACAAAW